MFVHQVQDGIAKATRVASVDEIMRLTWKGLAEGHLDDTAAEAIAEAAEARRQVLREYAAPRLVKLISAPRRPPRSPNRQRSMERRRGLAASGAVPSRIACHFTLAEVAVLTVIARQVRWRGHCDLHIDRIAALAGVSRTSVQNALRQARRLGLITVQERRYRGQRSDTNLIKVVSNDWKAWIERGGRVQKPEHHEDTRKTKRLTMQEKGSLGQFRSPLTRLCQRQRPKDYHGAVDFANNLPPSSASAGTS